MWLRKVLLCELRIQSNLTPMYWRPPEQSLRKLPSPSPPPPDWPRFPRCFKTLPFTWTRCCNRLDLEAKYLVDHFRAKRCFQHFSLCWKVQNFRTEFPVWKNRLWMWRAHETYCWRGVPSLPVATRVPNTPGFDWSFASASPTSSSVIPVFLQTTAMIFKNRINSSPTSINQQYIYPHSICDVLTRPKQYIPPSRGVDIQCLSRLSQLNKYLI